MLSSIRYQLERLSRRPLGRAFGVLLLLMVTMGSARRLEVHAHADASLGAVEHVETCGDRHDHPTQPPGNMVVHVDSCGDTHEHPPQPPGTVEVHSHIVATADLDVPDMSPASVVVLDSASALVGDKPLPHALVFRAPPHRPPIV